MSAETATSLRGYDAPNQIYEPLINPKIVKAEITALLNMIRSSLDVNNKRLFKVAADVYETVRNAVGNINKGDSVQLSESAHFSLEELPQNIGGKDPVQIIRMFYSDTKGKRILTLSRHSNVDVKLRDESEDDLDKPYHRPKTRLTNNDKRQILETLLRGLNAPQKFKPLAEIFPAPSTTSPSQPPLFSL